MLIDHLMSPLFAFVLFLLFRMTAFSQICYKNHAFMLVYEWANNKKNQIDLEVHPFKYIMIFILIEWYDTI